MTAFVIYYWHTSEKLNDTLNGFIYMCKKMNFSYVKVNKNTIAINYQDLLNASSNSFSHFLVDHYIRRIIFTTNKYIELINEFSSENYELTDIHYGIADDELEAEYQFQSLIELNDISEIVDSIKHIKAELEYDLQRITYREPRSKLKLFLDRRGLITFESGTESIEINKTLQLLVCGSATCER